METISAELGLQKTILLKVPQAFSGDLRPCKELRVYIESETPFK